MGRQEPNAAVGLATREPSIEPGLIPEAPLLHNRPMLALVDGNQFETRDLPMITECTRPELVIEEVSTKQPVRRSACMLASIISTYRFSP